MDGYHFPADAMFRGEQKAYGALITYSLNIPKDSLIGKQTRGGDSNEGPPRRDTAKVSFEVLDASGAVIRKFAGSAERGINRAVWNLRMDASRTPRLERPAEERFTPQGPEVLPGTYTVRIKAGKTEASTTVQVLADPRTTIAQRDRQAKFDLMRKVGQRLEVAAEAVDRIVAYRKIIGTVLTQAQGRSDDRVKPLRTEAEKLRKKLSAVADRFIDEPNRVQGITRNPNTVSVKLGSVLGSLRSSWDAPTSTQLTNLRQAETLLESALKEFNKVFAEDVAAFQKTVESAELKMFPEQKSLDMDWKSEKKEKE
jgi:hypothetical protein